MKSARWKFIAAVCALSCSLVLQAQAQEAAEEAGARSEEPDPGALDTTEFEGFLEVDPDQAEEPARAEQAPGIEEITVTAQRRESIVQETPVAITVFDQAQLDERGVSDLQGLSFNVPNFHYGEVLGQARITIRGISTAGGDQAAAFHIDGIYQNSSLIPSGLTFFDIARVETLRGPQGTLAGRNATGGAIFVVTQPPEFDFELFGDMQFGNYHEIVTRGVLNIPIVEDKVAARVSVIQDRHYGYTENLFYDVRSRDVDDKRVVAMRSQLRVQPVESVDWVVRSIYSRSKPTGGGLRIDGALPPPVPVTGLPDQDFYNTPPPGRAATPPLGNERKIVLDTPEQTDTTLKGASSTLTLDLPSLAWLGDTSLIVMGSWQKRIQQSFSDVDRTEASAFAAASPPLPLVVSDADLEQKEWVVEANWTSQNAGEPLSWVAGIFYLGTEGSLAIGTHSNLPLRNIPLLGNRLGIVDTASLTTSKDRSVAGFFDASWEFIDPGVTLTGGVRYTVDWKQETSQAQQANIRFPFLPPSPFNPICVISPIDSDKDDRWDAWTGRALAQWQFRESNMVYWSYSRGYKAGTIEHAVPDGCDARTPLPNTDPETINAFEIGLKNDFFENRFQANVTSFYYDYDNIQVATLVEATVVTQNAAGAELAGVELELAGLPMDELLLTLNFAYLYTNFTDYKNGCLVEDASTCRPGGFIDFTGNELPRAPRMSGTVTAQYTLDLDQFGAFIPFAQIYASDRLYFRASNLETDRQDAYWLFDARLTWQSPSENLMWEFFVANAFDKDIVNTKLISTPLLGSPQLTAYAPPRTFGTRVTLRW